MDFSNSFVQTHNINYTSPSINKNKKSYSIRKVSPHLLKSNTVDFAELTSMKSLFDQEDMRTSSFKRHNRFLKAITFQNSHQKHKKKQIYSTSIESASSSSDHDRQYNTCNSALAFLAQATLDFNSSFDLPSESEETQLCTEVRQLIRQPSVDTNASKLSLEYLFRPDHQKSEENEKSVPDIILPSSSSLNSVSDSTTESDMAIGFDVSKINVHNFFPCVSKINVRDLSPCVSENPTYLSDSSNSVDSDSVDIVSTNSESLPPKPRTPPISRIVSTDRPNTPPISKIVYLSNIKPSFHSPLTDVCASRSVSPYNSSSFSNSQSTILHNTPPLPTVSNTDVECIVNNEPSLIKLEENVCPVFSDNITASECSSHAFNCDDRNVETAESPGKITHIPMHRRSSDSEINSAPKGIYTYLGSLFWFSFVESHIDVYLMNACTFFSCVMIHTVLNTHIS